MTKQQILDHFKDINHVYNECTRYDDLKRMLDELEEEHEAEWIQSDWDKKHATDDRTVCSNCGREYTDYIYGYEWDMTGELPKYCPNCGHKMKNATKEENEAKLIEKAMTLQTQAIVESYVKGGQ